MGVVNSRSDPKGREIRGDDKTDTMHPLQMLGSPSSMESSRSWG